MKRAVFVLGVTAAVVACSSFGSADPPVAPPVDAGDDRAVSSDGGPITDGLADADGPGPPEAPTFLSPSSPLGRMTTGERVDYTIGFLEDGVVTNVSPAGTFVDKRIDFLSAQANDHLMWSASGVPHKFDIVVDPLLRNIAGAIVFKVRFSGATPINGPLIAVGPGAAVTASVTYRMWSTPPGPAPHQIIYGIDKPVACLGDDPAAPRYADVVGYPTGTIAIAAPQTIGIAKIRMAFTSEATCALAMTKALDTTEIAAIVVK